MEKILQICAPPSGAFWGLSSANDQAGGKSVLPMHMCDPSNGHWLDQGMARFCGHSSKVEQDSHAFGMPPLWHIDVRISGSLLRSASLYSSGCWCSACWSCGSFVVGGLQSAAVVAAFRKQQKRNLHLHVWLFVHVQ